MEAETSIPIAAHRTLAAIVFTDAVGFSARVGSDEDGTVALIRQDLDLMSALCKQFDGQVIKSRGDGLMMLFTSAVQAVNCAVEIQRAFAERAKNEPDVDVLMHRIGIHLGDVLVAEGDALGDGVNVAARLEQEAAPGGICLSQTVYDVVKGRLFLQAVKIGDLRLKNITEPISAYSVGGVSKPKRHTKTNNVHWAPLAVLGAALVVFGAGGMAFYMSRHQEPEMKVFRSLPSNSAAERNRDPGIDIARNVDDLIANSMRSNEGMRLSNKDKQEVQNEQKLLRQQLGSLSTPGDSGDSADKSEAASPASAAGSEGVPVPPLPPQINVSGMHFTPETMFYGRSASKPSKAFEGAWKKYVEVKDFNGMAKWLDRHMDTVPISEYGMDLAKYHQLANFMELIKGEMANTGPDSPVHVTEGGHDVKVWQRTDGKLVFQTGSGQSVRDFESLKPFTVIALTNGMMKSLPAAMAQKDMWRQQLKSFAEEFRKRSQLDSGDATSP